ncbi:hypothetical protein SAMN04487897_12912 [Paenibacillus sp. yr247]|uniref:hypothetical protein n=1 Tax=Paenibacillus sp. yr247 TaxID=1761880 RepID=UPI000883FC96|nr:hypothetical protein [Paenibacillus sp. yr247]SDO98403.1 hypothetical protein SAMN04487897_12912 [Paenibacillus sp. yr247]
MRKRLTFTIISITLVALMLCGWTAYAATSPNTSISTSVTGTFKAVSSDAVTVITDKGDQTVPLAKSVWVYRDDQKAKLADLHAGDRIELIVNSKQQAAYVKATSTGSPKTEAVKVPAAPEPTPSPTPATSGTNEQAAATVTKEPVSTTQPSSQKDQEVYPDLEDIDLKVDGKHLKLHIEQTKGSNGILYDLSIKPEKAGTIHLKGNQAAVWIKMLLASVDLKSSDAEKVLAQQLAEHYDLDASKLNIQIKMKWQQKLAPSKQEQPVSHENEQNQEGEHQDKDDHKDDSKSTDKDQDKSVVTIKSNDSNKDKQLVNDKNNKEDDDKDEDNNNKNNNNHKNKEHKNNERSGKHDDRQKNEKQRGSNHDD